MNTTTLGSALLVASVTLAVSGCEKKPAQQKPDEVKLEKPVKQATRRPDVSRVFKHQAGERAQVVAAPQDAKVLGVQVVDGHTYVRFDSAAERPSRSMDTWIEGGALTECGRTQEPYGYEFVASLKGSPDEATARWVNAEVTRAVGVTYRRHEAKVTLAGAPREEGLEKMFFTCAGEALWEMRWQGSASAYYAYAGSRLKALGSGDVEATRADVGVGVARPGDLEQMMSLYTGMSSIEEALQTERGLMVGNSEEERDVPLASIEGVGVAAHPWGEMINELGRESVHAPMAEVVPFDMAYVHFHDVRDFVRTARRFEEVLLPAAAAIEGGEGTSNVSARYERELIMRRTSISEAMGDVAVKSFAIVASDPFLREGADVTLLFEVNNEAALKATLARFVVEAKAERADLAESSYEVGGQEVTLWSTPDGAHGRHMVEVGGVLAVSNSRAALARIVETAAGRRDALTSRGDFKYMRALYPFSEEGEDGFVFIGDDFVREAISPRAKILSSRRVRARADLAAVNSAALLHGWLEGAPPETLDEMVKSGALAPGLEETFEGEPITFTRQRGARSARWGTLAASTPLAEVDIKAATKQEAEAYGAFNETYQQYWRRFIDPIGVRLVWSDEGELEVDARMLPLIEGTSYDEIIDLVGRKRFALERPPVAGVAFFYGLGEGASLRSDLSRLVEDMSEGDDVRIDWAGEWVGFGLGDRSGLWDVAYALGGIPTTGARAYTDGWGGLMFALARLPLWAMVEVKDEVTLRRALRGLESELSRSGDFAVWSASEPYRDVTTYAIVEKKGFRESLGDSLRGLAPLDLHYAVAGGVLVLALERELLEEKIDDVLDGRVPKASPLGVEGLPNLTDSATQATMTVTPWPKASDLVDTVAGLMESSAMGGAAASAGMLRVLADGLGPQALGSDEAIDAAAMTYFGVSPYAPHGGGWSVGPGGEPSHALYGSMTWPNILALPVKGSPVTALLESLVGLEMSLGFDGDGTHRGLHTRLRWRAR